MEPSWPALEEGLDPTSAIPIAAVPGGNLEAEHIVAPILTALLTKLCTEFPVCCHRASRFSLGKESQ